MLTLFLINGIITFFSILLNYGDFIFIRKIKLLKIKFRVTD